ncbi:fimbrial protein [Providencia alcalifaciens]|uniref:fimbrial protein n=1 Tax=Providencia alcalifaciens TaxID=126385 RepID=UPI0018A7539E
MTFNSLLKFLLLSMLFSFNGSAHALYISSDISSMDSEGEFFSKPYINDTKKTNLYSFSAYQIDKPGSHEQGRAIHDGEIIFTPLKKILLPGEQEFFKIFYRGAEDNQERYYKIIISETPLEMQNDKEQRKQPLFYPTVSLETYFVVRPKQPDFKYTLDQNAGILKNTGNTYFRVLLHNNCGAEDDTEPYVLYLLPNQTYQDERLTKKSRKYIVIFDKYYAVGNCE